MKISNSRYFYGSFISGSWRIEWQDFSEKISFNFSTKFSNPQNVWSAIGLSKDQYMVREVFILKLPSQNLILENTKKRETMT